MVVSTSGTIASFIPLLLIILILLLVFRPIAKKAGYSGWWVLTLAIPWVNLIMIWVFAFAKWPAQRDRKDTLSSIRCPNCNKMVMPPRIFLPEGFDAGMQEFSCPECGASVVIPMS